MEKALPESISLLLIKNSVKDISQKITFSQNLTAPIKRGQKIGTVEIFVGDKSVAAEDITAKDDVKTKSFLSSFENMIRGLFIL